MADCILLTFSYSHTPKSGESCPQRFFFFVPFFNAPSDSYTRRRRRRKYIPVAWAFCTPRQQQEEEEEKKKTLSLTHTHRCGANPNDEQQQQVYSRQKKKTRFSFQNATLGVKRNVVRHLLCANRFFLFLYFIIISSFLKTQILERKIVWKDAVF